MKKVVRSFGFAGKGIAWSFRTQFNFRIHIIAALLVTGLGWWVRLSLTEWVCVVLCFAMVMVTEMVNTAIEVLVDLVSPGYHSKAGLVKDIAAGAVLISAILAAIIGCVIFIPKLW
ncbi:diacylglycerol kinase family protein [Hufsiella ginkgonis]|uniref:Diacylglycerol kinase n=1 Tax=Hufsiella ginkgonis TaxID=2695274 RepID=A0A7K1Y3Z3_9SPHI|nr:diacylglycerol kinase [Hufsiella ginkgonis]